MMKPMNPINMSKNWPLYSILLTMTIVGLLSFMVLNHHCILLEWGWLHTNSNYLSMTIMLDMMGMIFISAVSFVALNTFMFSDLYMGKDPKMSQFSLLLFAFVMSMVILILIPNMITMMLGWDGLGITSFLLIMYYSNPKSGGGALVTLMTNRLGDATLILAMVLSSGSGAWNLYMNKCPSSSLSMMIIVTAMSKSSQFPLCMWLPEAMAAPTPVSALVHSSTLVTAGVFLLIRFFNTLNLLQSFKSMMFITGSLTMLGGGLWALTMMDVKKVVALSTMSQLGLMVSSLSMGQITFAYFHLITHAMFKSLMFISVGMLIVIKSHKQDFSPIMVTHWNTVISYSLMTALFSLNAMPYMAGWFSKEMILETTLYYKEGWVISLAIATLATAMYSTRVWKNAGYQPMNKPTTNTMSTTNNTSMVHMSVTNLSIMSCVAGSTMTWTMFTSDPLMFLNTLYHLTPPMSATLGMMMALKYYNIYSLTSNVNHSTTMWSAKPLTKKFNLLSKSSSYMMMNLVEHGTLMLLNYTPLEGSKRTGGTLSMTPPTLKTNVSMSLSWMFITLWMLLK